MLICCIVAIRILDPYKLTTASDEARALTHALSHIDIYSNSWGPSDDGTVFSELSLVHIDALKKGVTEVNCDVCGDTNVGCHIEARCTLVKAYVDRLGLVNVMVSFFSFGLMSH